MAGTKAKDELVAAYIAALGLTRLDVAPDLWFAKPTHAELVAAQLGPDARAEDVATVATSLGAGWLSTEKVRGDAEAEVEEIEQHLEAFKQAGGISSFNGAYKRYRQLCLATLNPAVAYSSYLHAFKIKVVDQVARNIAAGNEKFAGVVDLKPDPLPVISRRTLKNVATPFEDKVSYQPLHLTRKGVHRSRRLRLD